MESTGSEKLSSADVQHVDSAPAKDTLEDVDVNEQIVQHLMTTGQEVGMTWHTVFAVIVSSSARFLAI